LPTNASPSSRASWAGIPAEDRRAARQARLLDAAFDLLATQGWSATTVRGVCQHAALNPRYFYESFDDLDALLVAVYDRTVEQLAKVVAAAGLGATGDDPEAETRRAIAAIVGFVDEDRRRGRILYIEALGNEPLNRRRREAGFALIDVIEHDSAQRRGGRGDAIGRIGAAFLVGGFSELLANWLEGRIDVGRDQLIDDGTALLLALSEAAAAIRERREAEAEADADRPAGSGGPGGSDAAAEKRGGKRAGKATKPKPAPPPEGT
jgi:AcrR family transcriptional regulator